MPSSEQLFVAILRDERVKAHLFRRLSTADISSVRRVSSACCNLVTKHLFTRIHVTFTSSTFTKPSRVAALRRIGHFIQHLTFHMSHSPACFLPPLVHPLTGQEISFLYTPHTSMSSVLTRPKYANTELADILTQQYPPLFHAATNVASFINAFNALVNVRHLTIRCPGQNPCERYRRDIVDYALISLRIAVEKAPLQNLNRMSLSSVHPAAFNYLRHTQGFGSVPSAGKRWKQVKKLSISMESWDFYGPSPGLDHLKIIDDYVRFFSPGLDKFSFSWLGNKGPCPLALASDTLFAPPPSSKKLFKEVTSNMSPLPMRPGRSPIQFPKLRYLQIRNVTMNVPQLSKLIKSHSFTVKEFDFQNVTLNDNGKWDEALALLCRDETWARISAVAPSECSFVTSESSDDIQSPSAAVQAVGRELMGHDLGLPGFAGQTSTAGPATALELDDSKSFTTKLRRKRIRRRRKKRHDELGSSSASRDPRSCWAHRLDRKPSQVGPEARCDLEAGRPYQSKTTAPVLVSSAQHVLLHSTVFDPLRTSPDSGITSVQRNLEQEEAHRLLAEDAEARKNALRRAKEAVLFKLGREFRTKRPRVDDVVAACHAMASKQWSTTYVVPCEAGRPESQGTLVPLILSQW